MRSQKSSNHIGKSLLFSASTLGLITAVPALAQEADAETTQEEAVEEDVIVVSGIRQSLESAQNVKRNADTVVDVVTASDIGALPDRSVSEVLQRVPGVNVLRFAGPNDPDHFAVEGSGVSIRGFPFVRSELNGRDVFGANSAGVLGFEDVSPELLGSVVVFKNQTSDLIEGGLAGTIDLRTRVPFDKNGQLISGTVEFNFTDFAKELTPTISGLYSNNWDTDSGRFGILFNGSYSRLKSRADATSIANFVEADFGAGTVLVPTGGGVRSQEFDRERLSLAGAAQYESPDGRWLATAQFLRSDSDLTWGENVSETAADGSGPASSFDPTDFVFDDNGVFQSGTITDNSQWRGPNATAALLSPTGGQQLFLNRERFENDVTNDYGFNLKFAASDNLRFNFDAQYVESTARVIDLTVHGSTFAPIFLDLTGGGAEVTHIIPDGAAANFYQDPSNYFLRSAMDHQQDNEADSLSFRGDVEYDFSSDGWLRSVRAGARYNKQETTIRASDFNWGNISEVWTSRDVQGNSGGDFNAIESLVLLGGNSNPDVEAAVAGLFSTERFLNFNRGLEADTGLIGGAPFYNGPRTEDYEAWAAAIEGIRAAAGGATGSGPFGGPYATLGNRVGADESLIPGSVFFPSEVGNVDRETFAAYARFDYGFDDIFGDLTELTGNIGLRYVRTDRTVDTVERVPSFDALFGNQLDNCPGQPGFMPDPGQTPPGFCSEDLDALRAFFGDGSLTQVPVDLTYDYFLPSFNAKLDLTNGHIIRFAASRTLARPSNDDVFQRVRVNTAPETTIEDGMGGFINVFNGFEAAGLGGSPTGSADLLPQLAWNFDLAYEWYFANAGSVTLTGFYKEIDNFINFEPRVISAAGLDLPRNTLVNAEESASLKGFEVSYQQFYDFLPGALSGLGLQLNYAFIDAEGVEPTIDPNIPAEDDIPIARFEIDQGIFPRVSRHNVNVIGLYEKGVVQARVAYNWRSSFQLTPRDVIFPFASIYQPATGQVDASIFFDVNDVLKVGVQGVNLLDDVTETTQSINEAGLRAPRNGFTNDRRISFVLRATY
ncbi:TonB-dependent receptor [Erythrobacter sp. W53]|uniref:TonB-dependent receptor n=1 Tax=Erythrobacter sp. W53 TaxID=3425947 RepID=UPI003D76A0C6